MTETEILWMLKHVSVDSEAAGVSAELRRCGDTGPGVASLVHSPCASVPHQDEPHGSDQGQDACASVSSAVRWDRMQTPPSAPTPGSWRSGDATDEGAQQTTSICGQLANKHII